MLYLHETALDIAQNYAHDEDSDQLLAEACEMGVLDVTDEETGAQGRAINVFLPSRDTDAAPAIAQVILADDGSVIENTPFDQDTVADLLAAQIEDAQARIDFCKEAMHNLGFELAD
jgi:hypothetical protein